MIRFSKLIYWLPPLIWIVTIFSFSAHPSLQTSTVVWQDFIIKKTAHFLEYAVLTALFTYSLSSTTHLNWTRALIIALILSTLYASTDEFHQSFVPGREPRIRDVLIDTGGSLVLVILSWRHKWLDTDNYRA